MKLTTVLVPTDLTQYSLMVLPYALALAEQQEAKLLLAHVALAPVEQAAAAGRLADIIREVGLVNAEAMVVTGDCNSGLLQIARSRHASLIVMSSHARSGVTAVLMGSTAAALVHTAPCPVIVLKSPAVLLKSAPIPGPAEPPYEAGPVILRQSPPTAEDAYFAEQERQRLDAARRRQAADRQRPEALRLSLQTIILPMDFSQAALAALEVTRSLLGSYHARLVLLHVLAPNAVRENDDAAGVAYDRLKLLANDIPGATVEVDVGPPGPCIAWAADRRHADLVVMGTHGATRLRRLLMGSTSEGVMRQAPCPVMVVRDDLAVAPEPADLAETTSQS